MVAEFNVDNLGLIAELRTKGMSFKMASLLSLDYVRCQRQ
jgi:hypothetical protein